jgi:two-component system, chemotaxis family, protein-glutamate methylesterase/glutaminase
MAKIRVLVVEDSPTVGHHLREVLTEDPDLDVTGVARDGRAAIELTASQRPDVITMDMMLPVVHGLAAIEHIMAHCPTPILVVSSSDNRADLFTTYDALAAGAVDVLEKYQGRTSAAGWAQQLRRTVKLVARIPVITHPRARLAGRERNHAPSDQRPVETGPSQHRRSPPPLTDRGCQVIGIGASTGGPAAVVEVLRMLPTDCRVPILLVQHISAPFAAAYVDWLGDQIGRPAAHAHDGEAVAATAGRVVVAPPDRHLVVKDGRLRLTSEPERNSCRPSIDYLFEALAREYGGVATACLLTGMGRDGATGLLAVRRMGGVTIAQDEATCAVYGMPREAVLLNAAAHVLGPAEIGRRLADLAPASTASPGGPP